MGRIAAIPFFHPKTAKREKISNAYFCDKIPTYLQKIFTGIDIKLKSKCTANKVPDELGLPIMIIREIYMEDFKKFLVENKRYLPKFKELKELLEIFRPDAYCMYYLHIPDNSQASFFLESRFCPLNEEVKITKIIDQYVENIKEDFYTFLEEWVGLVINIAAEYVMFKLKSPAIFFNCERCFRPALMIKNTKLNEEGNPIEGQKLWGTANIVDVLMYTSAEKYGFDNQNKNKLDLVQCNFIYHDESFLRRKEEVYSDCEFFQRHINGAFILTFDKNSFCTAMEEIKKNGENEQFDLIVTGSSTIKIMEIIIIYEYLQCFKNIFIFTFSPDKYLGLKNTNEKIKEIFFDKGELIDYIQEHNEDRPIYQLTKLISYDDYLYKYHILHEMISEQYGKYTEDCYNAAISVIQDFLYWYPQLNIEKSDNFEGTKIELLIGTLQNFKDISSNEKNLIKIYTRSTGSFYNDFNKWLRELDPFAYKKISWFIAALMYQLNRYGNVHGLTESKTLYRGIKMNYTDLLLYKRFEGRIVCFPSFTSSTEKKEVAENFNEKDGDTLEDRKNKKVFFVTMVINYKFSNNFIYSAIDISKCSDYPNEEERLFPPFTFFKLNKLNIDYNNYTSSIELDSIGRKEILEKRIRNGNILKYNKLGFMEIK